MQEINIFLQIQQIFKYIFYKDIEYSIKLSKI